MLQCTSSLKMRMDQERRSIWIIINIIVKDCMNIFLPREYPDMPSKRLFQLPPPVYFTWHYFHLKFVCMCRAKSYFKWIMSFLFLRPDNEYTFYCLQMERNTWPRCKVWPCCDPAQGRSGGRGRGRGCRPPWPSRSRRGWRSPPPSRSSRAGSGLPPGRRNMEAGAGAGRLNEVSWYIEYILSTIKMRHYNSLLSSSI